MNELQMLQLTRLIQDGASAQAACKLVGVPRSTLNKHLTLARRQAQGATEEQRLKQRFYPLLKAYESAQRERSKALRKRRENSQGVEKGMNQHPMVYRDIQMLPPDVRQRILDHLKNGSWLADAVEAEKVHASVALAWTERGFQAFLGGLEDEESTVYRDWYLDILAALSQAKTSAAERVFSDSPLSFLLYGPGREQPDRQGYVKSSRVTSTVEKQPLKIETVWATASHPKQIGGGQPPYKVTFPDDYQPPDRSDWPTEEP